MSLAGGRLEILYRCVVEVESSGNPFAIRYEPRFANRILSDDPALRRAIHYYHANLDTLRSFLAFSVGRIQVLIYNLFFYDDVYDFVMSKGFKPCIPYYLPEHAEKELFHILLKSMGIDFFPFDNEELLYRFAKHWNGSPAYAKRLKIAYTLQTASYKLKPRYRYG